MRGCLWMPQLPTLQSGQCVFLSFGAADFNQRMFGYATLGRLHSLWFARLLAILRRPGRIAFTFAFVARRQFEQRFDRALMLIDGLVQITVFTETRRHARQCEIAGLTIIDFVPT